MSMPNCSPPVADMVLANDAVALELDDAADGVADDRAAQMPDVHLLGDVVLGIVDNSGQRRRRLFPRRAVRRRRCIFKLLVWARRGPGGH